MPQRYFHFLGFLAYANRSIKKLSLKNRFRFDIMDYTSASDLLSKMKLALSPYKMQVLSFPGNNLIAVKKSMRIPDKSKASEDKAFHALFNQIDRNVQSPIKRLRLYKETSVCMPIYILYKQVDSIYEYRILFEDHNIYNKINDLDISDSEVKSLNTFIYQQNILFTNNYISTCYDMFELSYRTQSRDISFITLMVGLESLFNVGDHEIAKTISRHTAVLLAQDKSDGENIFYDMKKLYKIRSKIVHGGKHNIVKDSDLLALRDYVRKSIRHADRLSMDKNELHDVLNAKGFGDIKK